MDIVAVIAVVALAASACGGTEHKESDSDEKTLIVGIDLPLQGTSKEASESIINAMKLYLERLGDRVGKYPIELKVYDNATAAKGGWDDATCAKNAQEHVATENQVAVMGTDNSGCTKIELPILNQDPRGPMLMVSHASTNPGLTKSWDVGEPEKYYRSGKRNYARVITTDDYQGSAAAQFAAKDLKVKKCYVVNDGETYGQGVAMSFVTEAGRQGIEVLGNQVWNSKQSDYEKLFKQVKAKNPDCVYLAGIYDNNGGQLVKDKVKVLGDNTAIKLIASDGFIGVDPLLQQPEAADMYLTFLGQPVDQLRDVGGAAAKLLDSYKAKYGKDLTTSFAIYGVQSLQVILAAIEKSDGSRPGVTNAVFSGEGITIPAATAVLGKDIKIDTQTGDVGVRDISIMTVKDKKETFIKPWLLS